MSAAVNELRVVRRTFLHAHEKRTNFTPIDNDILEAVCSDEASKVTDKMSKIYLRLLRIRRGSPFFQSEGVVCFPGEQRAGKWLTGFDQMVEYLGVAPATARKALDWMKQKAIIGYVCPKGYPTRIWLNHAATSIAARVGAGEGSRLRLVQGGTAPDETTFFHGGTDFVPAFKEETQHEDFSGSTESHAPDGAADNPPQRKFVPTATNAPRSTDSSIKSADTENLSAGSSESSAVSWRGISGESLVPDTLLSELGRITATVARLDRKLSSVLPDCAAAVRAEVDDQMELHFRRIRQYVQERAIPQAARVGQLEAYKILRNTKQVATKASSTSGLYVGSSQSAATTRDAAAPTGRPERLTREAALELAEFIWAENGRAGGAIEQTLDSFARQWAAEQRFSDAEIELLRRTVLGHEVRDRIASKKAAARQPVASLASPGSAETNSTQRSNDARENAALSFRPPDRAEQADSPLVGRSLSSAADEYVHRVAELINSALADDQSQRRGISGESSSEEGV